MKRVPLRNRYGLIVAHALVDDEDFAVANEHRWYRSIAGYATRGVRVAGKSTRQYLHRELLGLKPKDGLEGDHKNGDPLDNRRENLRIATGTQNRRNVRPRSAGFKGVWEESGRWRARIYDGQRPINLGSFDTAEQAAVAYDREARSRHGDFARLNFPDQALNQWSS